MNQEAPTSTSGGMFTKTNRKYFRKSPAVCTADELSESIIDDWLHLRSKEEEFEEILNKCSQE